MFSVVIFCVKHFVLCTNTQDCCMVLKLIQRVDSLHQQYVMPFCFWLQELHVDGCQNITDESVEAVVQFCPNIQIFLFHNCPLITGKWIILWNHTLQWNDPKNVVKSKYLNDYLQRNCLCWRGIMGKGFFSELRIESTKSAFMKKCLTKLLNLALE